MKTPWVFAFLLFSIQGIALAETAQQVCGLTSGSSLIQYQDSADEFVRHVSPLAGAAIAELKSFPDIQALLREAQPAQVCATAIAVGKNIYQYDSFLVVLSMRDRSQHGWMLPMLFQTSSVQAHENTGPRPWLGFDRTQFVKLLKKSIAGLAWSSDQAAVGADWTPLSVNVFPAGKQAIDSGSVTYAYVPDFDSKWKTYLVSRLRRLDTGNPFTSQVLLDLGIVQVRETGVIRHAVLPKAFDLVSQMADLQSSVHGTSLSPAKRAQLVKDLSF
jgi:hypothetical protein